MRNKTLELLKSIKLVVFDFDGVFTNNRVVVSEDGSESVVCLRSDGLGLKRLNDVKVQSFILSTETNPVVAMRARKLGIQCIHGVDDKLSVLKKELARRKVPVSQTAFVGNDINDADCLKTIGLPVVVADAWPEVVPFAKLVLKRRGGDGAVREFCDMIWESKKSNKRRSKSSEQKATKGTKKA